MTTFYLPFEVEAVFRRFRTCEFTTFAKDGTPITWPLTPLYQPERGGFLFTACVGLSQKVFNIKRNAHVSLLFSDSTGSGLASPPAVLVQGDAAAPGEIVFTEGLEGWWRLIFQRHADSRRYIGNPLVHMFLDYYYMRLPIYVTPRRIMWWPQGDFGRTAGEVGIVNVA